MKRLQKQKNKRAGAGEQLPPPQTRQVRHPFTALSRYLPLARGENALYDAIREAVPIVDAAVGKILALTGGFRVVCSDPVLQPALDDFAAHVPVGGSAAGLDAFVSQQLEQLLMYGTAVGEIVPTRSRRGVAALYTVPLSALSVEQDPATGRATICLNEGGAPRPAPYQQLLTLTALNPRPGEVCGRSLLKGLPFVTDILLKIYHTLGVNFERVGNVRFAVIYRPAKEAGERAFARERATQMAGEWQKAMRTGGDGSVSDFVAVGDVDVKVIGADNQVLDSEVPVRQMLEQIVAKTGLPPFMLGLSWSATERMSSQQADALTSELWAYRRLLTPVLEKVTGLWLRLRGSDAACRVVWNEMTLQDETAEAEAAYTRARTRLLERQLASKEESD